MKKGGLTSFFENFLKKESIFSLFLHNLTKVDRNNGFDILNLINPTAFSASAGTAVFY